VILKRGRKPSQPEQKAQSLSNNISAEGPPVRNAKIFEIGVQGNSVKHHRRGGPRVMQQGIHEEGIRHGLRATRPRQFPQTDHV